MGDLSYRLERAGGIAVLCDVPGPSRRPATPAEVELFAEMKRLRSILNDLLLTRQAHEEADIEEMRLVFGDDGSEEDGQRMEEAHNRSIETEKAHEAAWDRARSLLAGEEKG